MEKKRGNIFPQAFKNDALDVTVDRIIRQIRKQKTKVEKRLRADAFMGLEPDVEPEEDNYEVTVKDIQCSSLSMARSSCGEEAREHFPPSFQAAWREML